MAVPTIISSLWGMNVAVPFSQSSAGFWIVMGISVICALFAFIFMYKKRMFK